MKHREDDSQAKKRFDPMKPGKAFLLISVLINAVLLFVNLHQNGIQRRLSSAELEEQHFITNNQTVNSEIYSRSQSERTRNLAIMVRRLAGDHLTGRENSILKSNDSITLHDNRSSLIQIVAGTYSLSNDTDSGLHPIEMFKDKSETELHLLLAEFRNKANLYIEQLKQAINSNRETLQSYGMWIDRGLILNMICILVGGILIFFSEGRLSKE